LLYEYSYRLTQDLVEIDAHNNVHPELSSYGTISG
jgi:hypothetical protein